MKKALLKLTHYLPGLSGVYQLLYSIILAPSFFIDYLRFRGSQRKTSARFPLRIRDFFLCLFDKTSTTPFDPHYTYHPAWAARVVARINPEKHIDIASSLKFSTIVSAFVPVEFYDYRPAKLRLSGLESKHGDLYNLPFPDNSVPSLSCMHTIEHIGLGRYGDPIDYDGDIKAINELKRVLASGGALIFVVPLGKPRIQYNAHRIYSYEQIIEYFSDLTLEEFSLVPDDYRETGMILNADSSIVADQRYACGCFVFTK